MTFGWGLALGVTALLAGALIVESIRIPRLESWCRARGFTRLDPRSERDMATLAHALERFEDGSTIQWGYAMSGQASGLSVAIGELDWRFGPKNRYRYTMTVLSRPGAGLPAMVVEARTSRSKGSRASPIWSSLRLRS